MKVTAMFEMDFPHLARAPIAEAVVEIRAEAPVPVVEGSFDAMRKRLSDAYPHASAVRSVSTRIDLEHENSTVIKGAGSIVGLRLESSDRKTVVVAKNDSLVVSRLEPYETWGALLSVVRLVWPLYIELFAPVSVVRLGVRYINRITFAAGVDLDTIFTAGPKVPPELPQGFAQYQTQVLVPMETHGALLTISQALDPSVAPGRSGALLDIDAFSPMHSLPDSPEIWTQLEKLRYVKNKAFFSSLHQHIWERYQ